MSRNARFLKSDSFFFIFFFSLEKIPLNYLPKNICKGPKNTFYPEFATLQNTTPIFNTPNSHAHNLHKQTPFQTIIRFSHLHTQHHLHTKFHVKIYTLAYTIFFPFPLFCSYFSLSPSFALTLYPVCLF